MPSPGIVFTGTAAAPLSPERNNIRSSQRFTVAQAKAMLAAAEYGSLRKAASHLRLSQPQLSRCIRDMEAALGTSLFSRKQHGVCLTEMGSALIPHARQLIDTYEGMLSFMAGRRSGQLHALRIAADSSIAPVVLPLLQERLQSEYPGAALELQVMGSEDSMRQVLQHACEFGLTQYWGQQADLRNTPLLRTPLGLIIPPGCEIAESIHSLHDLAHVPMIRLAECCPVTQVLRRERIDFPAYFQSTTVFTCLNAAFEMMRQRKMVALATGIGASLTEIQDMRFVPLAGLLPGLSVQLLSAADRMYDPQTERMRDLVRQSVHAAAWHPSVRRLNMLQP